MSKKTIAIFYILSIVLGLIGAGLLIGGLAGSTITTTNTAYGTSGQVQSVGNPALLVTGVILIVLGGILHLISWVGALVALARLQEWVWFILMILFSSICLLIYLIIGPSVSRATPAYVPEYSGRADMPPQPPQYPS